MKSMHLEIKDVSYSFDGKQNILEKLNVHVGEGEFVTILGPSGSGKSTLFHLTGGILKPDHGDILLDGKKINGLKGHISYMPQQPSLLPWRTVMENVLLGSELAGVKDKKRAKALLIKAGLGEYEQAYPHELSGGMKQRAAFIRSILSPQDLMCLDEPFSALDELTRVQMQKWLMSFWEEYRRSVLFVTHSIDEAVFLSDRIYVLSSKPASVIKEVVVPFPRPRKEEQLLSDEFFQLKRELYAALKPTFTT
ncbi:ABC transporter ATP-binding protein [Peribacillus simplex]|uniref:ABC transporter ATP-binding protein n=1 Tax=Peribacillus simplex TaxID=1478 RepID=A0A120GPR2_9BACI|nr:ABC transporter ATP-binding protein [Peribacillus simplex]KWW20064.1 ABC transporter ATP-binding protein [Peribacillus simplex]